jgi:hypothetical protein
VLFFLFGPTTARAGEPVSVRLGGTPADFTPADRRMPLKRAIGIYLVPDRVATEVRSRFDPRIPVSRSGRYWRQMSIRLELPPPEVSCPVSRGRVGNGILSSGVPGADGVLATRKDADGTLFQKLGWLPKRGFHGNLVLRGERLDGPGEMKVLGVFWGTPRTDGGAGRAPSRSRARAAGV